MTAREIALDILKKTEASGGYSNIAIDTACRRYGLDERDRSLVSILVLGTIEQRITLDYYISRLSRAGELDMDTRLVLRMALYQLSCLDRLPAYAVVNDAVNMTKSRAKGFVNAVLRSFLRANCKIEIAGEHNSPEYMSIRYSIPIELCRLYIDTWGAERCHKIFDIFNSAPATTLRINTMRISRDEYEKRLIEAGIKYSLPDDALDAISIDGGAVTSLYGFAEGLFFIQDAASQYCVRALDVQEGQTVIDTCACPGSKSFGCAIDMKSVGKVYSFDLHKSKLSLIESGAERLGINIIKTAERDAREPLEALFGQADRVLCDVPCSGFGVVAKKPEIRYKDIASTERLPEIQREILDESAKYLKRGGVLVYSTCTVLARENEDVVRDFLEGHPEFTPCDFELGRARSEGGMLSLAPDTHGCDGFFIAKLKKK